MEKTRSTAYTVQARGRGEERIARRRSGCPWMLADRWPPAVNDLTTLLYPRRLAPLARSFGSPRSALQAHLRTVGPPRRDSTASFFPVDRLQGPPRLITLSYPTFLTDCFPIPRFPSPSQLQPPSRPVTRHFLTTLLSTFFSTVQSIDVLCAPLGLLPCSAAIPMEFSAILPLCSMDPCGLVLLIGCAADVGRYQGIFAIFRDS